MLAVRFDGSTLKVEEVPVPEPPPGEARVRVLLAGICNTDLEIVRGYAGFTGTLGHEFVGVVEAAPDAPDLEGVRVVGEINAACGTCPTCRAGRPTHCPHRTVLGIHGRDGAMAEHLLLPVANLHPVPEGVPDEVAVFTEPLAAALEIVDQFHVRPTERGVVIGDGKLGLLIARVLQLTGADVILVGKHPEKLAVARSWGIPTRRLAEGTDDLAGADWVVDSTGHPSGLELARRLLRPRGRLFLKSTFHGESGLNFSLVVVDEIQILGSRCGPFPPALRLLAAGLVDPRPLIHATYPLDRAPEAFERARAKGVLKVLLRP